MSAPEKGPAPKPGELFSRVYFRSATAQRDSARFRRRLLAWFIDEAHESECTRIAQLLQRSTGLDLPRGGYGVHWSMFFEKGELRDVLDAVSIIFQILAVHRPDKAQAFLAFVTKVFHDESLGYIVDNKGGVRYGVDAEYERNRFSMIEGLGGARYAAVRAAAESAFKRLDREPFDTKAAVREMFEGAETLCKLITSSNEDLDERMVQKRVKPIASRVYGSIDASAQEARRRACSANPWWSLGCGNARDRTAALRKIPSGSYAGPRLQLCDSPLELLQLALRHCLAVTRCANQTSRLIKRRPERSF